MMIHYSLYHDAVEKSRLINTVIKKKMSNSVGFFFFISMEHLGALEGLVYYEPYFKGTIAFSRAKITLREVTQGKVLSPMYQAMVQRNSEYF